MAEITRQLFDDLYRNNTDAMGWLGAESLGQNRLTDMDRYFKAFVIMAMIYGS